MDVCIKKKKEDPNNENAPAIKEHNYLADFTAHNPAVEREREN